MKQLLFIAFAFLSFNLHAQCTPNWLSTNGNQLIDTQGNIVKLSGVNWFGF